MSPEPVDSPTSSQGPRRRRSPGPRPGHADLVGMQKYGFDEARPSSSARAPARRPPASRSAPSRARSSASSASASSATPSRSDRCACPRTRPLPTPDDVDALDADPLRCFDAATSAAHGRRGRRGPRGRRHARRRRRGARLRPAAGTRLHVHWDRRLDAQARRRAHEHPGDQGRRGRRRLPHHDPPRFARRTTSSSSTTDGITRLERPAGGTEGGMSTGHGAAGPRRA